MQLLFLRGLTAGGVALVLALVAAPTRGPAQQREATSAQVKAIDHETLGHVSSMPTLTLAGARAMLDAVTMEAQRLGVGGGFAVVDAAGELIAFARLDGTFGAAANVSIGKARTAVRFHKETRAFEDSINGGRIAMAGMPDFTPLQGGVPVIVDGKVVGGIGVSGASSATQDAELAKAGVRALLGEHAR